MRGHILPRYALQVGIPFAVLVYLANRLVVRAPIAWKPPVALDLLDAAAVTRLPHAGLLLRSWTWRRRRLRALLCLDRQGLVPWGDEEHLAVLRTECQHVN